MADRNIILDILKRQLGDKVSEDKLVEAANAVVKALNEWEDVPNFETELGFNFAGFVECEDICYLASEIKKGSKFRLLKKVQTSNESPGV